MMMEYSVMLITDIPLSLLPDRMAICKLSPDADFPEWGRFGDISAFIQTHEEITVICSERFVPPDVKAERGWRVIKVQGPLDFTMVGVISSISAVLAQAKVSIFALSTYETDYFLVKEESLPAALSALEQANIIVNDPGR